LRYVHWTSFVIGICTEAPPSDVYLVRATCKNDTESWNESYEFQTSDDWLISWELAEG